jgi:hypothetical protein
LQRRGEQHTRLPNSSIFPHEAPHGKRNIQDW